MVVQQFGSEHTSRKLGTIEKYLSAFTTALKKQSFELLYVDACAGSGASAPKSSAAQGMLLDADVLTIGSAVRAMSIDPAFDRYVLNDVKRSNVRSLENIVSKEFPHLKDRVSVTQLDANAALVDLCEKVAWRRSRAVVFLDPFGLQIKYDTLEALAETRAVDLWYLVPVHAMSRQVSGGGVVLDDGGKSVDEALGTIAWRSVATVVVEPPKDLFGDAVTSVTKVANAGWFEQVAKERLAAAFGGRVLDATLPLGKGGLHEYSLMFAWANPSEPARLAAKLAAAVLK